MSFSLALILNYTAIYMLTLVTADQNSFKFLHMGKGGCVPSFQSTNTFTLLLSAAVVRSTSASLLRH